MLIETRVKISKEIDHKLRRYVVTYLSDNENLVDALATVIIHISGLEEAGEIVDADILSTKQSSIREVATQFDGDKAYIATLKDIWIDEVGDEKTLRYKVMLRASDLTECNSRVQQLSREGYDMQIESLVEMNIEYIESEEQ